MIAVRPKGTFAFTLPEEAELPADQRRTLTVRILSAGEWLDYADAYAKAGVAETEADNLRQIAKLLAGAVEGATPDELLQAFTPIELQYLARELSARQSITEIDAKKSWWRLPSPAAKSAEGAAQGSA